jgi:hypothetical protein
MASETQRLKGWHEIKLAFHSLLNYWISSSESTRVESQNSHHLSICVQLTMFSTRLVTFSTSSSSVKKLLSVVSYQLNRSQNVFIVFCVVYFHFVDAVAGLMKVSIKYSNAML